MKKEKISAGIAFVSLLGLLVFPLASLASSSFSLHPGLALESDYTISFRTSLNKIDNAPYDLYSWRGGSDRTREFDWL